MAVSTDDLAIFPPEEAPPANGMVALLLPERQMIARSPA